MKALSVIEKFKRPLAAALSALMLALCVCAALPAAAFADSGESFLSRAVKGGATGADYVFADADVDEITAALFSTPMKGGMAQKGVTMNNDATMDFSLIRVMLTISKQSRVEEIELYLTGEYYFTSDMHLLAGGDEPLTVRIVNNGGTIYAYDAEGNELTHGESLELNRVYVSYTAGYAQLHTEGSYTTSSTYGADGNKYLGNFLFDAKDSGHLRMINTVPLAHYIYGVVEHEMSYTKKPEALMAQAVAAKCYGMCFMSGTDDFDVEDGYHNTVYQMYRGFSTDAGKMTLLPLCFAVIGEGMAYQGKIIPTFYGASDGGETTLPSYVFNANDTRYDGAYGIRHDEVDFSASDRRRTITVTYGEPHPTDEYSSRFLDFILYKAWELHGVEYNRVATIDNMYAYDPHGNTTRDMRRVYVEATVTDGVMEEPVHVALDFPSSELKSLTLTDLDGSGDSYTSSKPGVFYVNYRIYWGEETSNGYKLYFCRHGNGIGLSQHGAAAMAEPQYGSKDHYEILAFYYPNFDYIDIKEADPEAPLLSTLTAAAYGRCAAANAELRSAPDIESSSVIMNVTLDEHIDVISVTDDGYWYLVLCGGHMGYLYYTKVRIDMFPAPADAVFTLYSGAILDTVRLYTMPTVYANYSEIVKGGEFTVWAEVGSWYYIVTSSGAAGYVLKNSVTIAEQYEYEGAEPILSSAGEPYYVTSLDYEFVKPITIGRRG